MSLVYLLASLPCLTLGATPLVSPEAFLAASHEQLDAATAAAAAALLADHADPHPFVQAWRDKEAILRNTVALRRAARRTLDPLPWLRPTIGSDLRIVSAVEEAFQISDPLARERALDRLRWAVADELQGPDPLSERALLAYAIRLRLAWRWAHLQVAKGRRRAEALTNIPLTLAS
jgi:hypothetical protein